MMTSLLYTVCLCIIFSTSNESNSQVTNSIGARKNKQTQQVRVRCTNVVHDLGSAEPRSKVEPSSRSITLYQVELRSADPIQLNGCGYTMDDADWSTMLGLRADYNDVTVTRNAYETVQYRLALICLNFKFP